MTLKVKLIRGALDALHASRAYRALEPITRGIGVIFTLHRVLPEHEGEVGEGRRFAPNRILEVTPSFLAQAIDRVRERGLEFVSLDEARRRIVEGDARRFAAITIDDGYRDTAEVAWPLLRDRDCPFTVYVATGLIDRTVVLWWIALERVVAGADRIEFPGLGTIDACSVEEKTATFHVLYWRLRAMGEAEKLDAVFRLCERYGIDTAAIPTEVGMDWTDLRSLASDPLATVGAHTVDHPALAKLEEEAMLAELIDGRARLAEMLGTVPRHLAYPYGDAGSAGPREFSAATGLGFDTAVTTRKGVIRRDHADRLAALPRISLNGDYQDLRYVDLFVSGVPFALMNGFRAADAA